MGLGLSKALGSVFHNQPRDTGIMLTFARAGWQCLELLHCSVQPWVQSPDKSSLRGSNLSAPTSHLQKGCCRKQSNLAQKDLASKHEPQSGTIQIQTWTLLKGFQTRSFSPFHSKHRNEAFFAVPLSLWAFPGGNGALTLVAWYLAIACTGSTSDYKYLLWKMWRRCKKERGRDLALPQGQLRCLCAQPIQHSGWAMQGRGQICSPGKQNHVSDPTVRHPGPFWRCAAFLACLLFISGSNLATGQNSQKLCSEPSQYSYPMFSFWDIFSPHSSKLHPRSEAQEKWQVSYCETAALTDNACSSK